LSELGYVEHEPSIAIRELEHDPPHVEFLLSAVHEDEDASASGKYRSSSLAAHERDAEQVAARIRALVSGTDDHGRQDAGAPAYKTSRFCCARSPVCGLTKRFAARRYSLSDRPGKGFYQREEITDLIQLLRFLDNTTDELALAAIFAIAAGRNL